MNPDAQAWGVLFATLGEIPVRMAAMERQGAALAAQIEGMSARLPPVLLPVSQAAAAWQVSIPTMRRWVKQGRVPVVKVGGTVRVDLSRLHGADELDIAHRAREARDPPVVTQKTALYLWPPLTMIPP